MLSADRLSAIASRLCHRRVRVRLNLARRDCGGSVAALAFLAGGGVEIRLTSADDETLLERYLHELVHLSLGEAHWRKGEAEREVECQAATESLERQLRGSVQERLAQLEDIARM